MKTRLKPVSDQVMVITGASSGIGLATALMAAERGARLVLIARSGETLEDIRGGLRDLGSEAIVCPADVADREALEAAARKAVERWGRIDTWVNDAGVSIYGRLDE